jgi:small-conductance mechanosensitive channel
MALRFRVLLCAALTAVVFWIPVSLAQAPAFLTGTSGTSAASPGAAPNGSASPAAASPAPKIDMAEITRRAKEATGVDIEARMKGWQGNLDRAAEALRKPQLAYSELNALRDELLKLRSDAEEFWTKLEPPLESVENQVQKMPAAPAQGEPPEPEATAKFRTELNNQLSYLRSARSSLDATHLRINQLLGVVQDIRRKNFTNRLFAPVPGVFSAQTWTTAPEYARRAAIKTIAVVTDWWEKIEDKEDVIYLAGAALVLWAALSLLSFFGASRLRHWPDETEPPFWRRASSAAGVIMLKSLPAVLPLVFIYNAIGEVQAFPETVGSLFYVAIRSIITIVVINALVNVVLSPSDHRWRLIPVSNWAAIRVSGLVLALALVYGLMTFLYADTRLMQAPFSLTLAVALPANLIVALLVIAILQTPTHEEHLEGMPSVNWLRALRIPVWIVVAGIILTAISGYLALSRFMSQQLVVTGGILSIVYLLLLWTDGLSQAVSDETSGIGSWLKNTAALDQERRGRVAVPISLLLKFAILICSVPLILLQWGYPWSDVMDWYRQLFFGFHIGSTQVSLAAILASIVVFVLGYFAAKFFQQWLDNQVLKPAGLSGGLRDSIRTGVGYIGISAAALVALSYAGFNLSNLAIVAGAFSVGIGFGLQSVVNNFVSGLILLAERPIKIGDLVIVGGEEGYVRKISVRSTEIETFDRANVLVPNSFFISEKVKNWTLRNNTGRIAVQVSVAHGSDPRQVKAILLQAAKANSNVMRTPEPFVDFEDFSSDMLTFKLFAFLYDLEKSIITRTDLRIAILDAFNEAGIAIPSRQTDVTVRDLDWLREAVKLYIAQSFEPKANDKAASGTLISAKPAE